jgi:GNAT superfamily N-acetyltransferase
MITVLEESLLDVLHELVPLFEGHYRELALNQTEVPLSPQYGVYTARAQAGGVLCVVAREAGKIVGYFVGFVAPGLHYSTCLTLTMDIFWVEPKARGQGAGKLLFKEVERCAKARGVQRMFVGSKLHRDASWLFQALGYTEVERYYSKWLGE